MSKARDLADLIAAGNPLADGTVEVADISDLTATAAELNYVDGVTSNIQTQLDAKGTVSSLSDLSITATATELNYNDIATLGTVEASKVVTADANGDVTFPDGEILKLGTGGDLRIFHNGSASYITDQGTGNLVLQASDALIVQNGAGTENLLTAYQNGAVTLYYDNSTKIATTSVGADVTGEFKATSYNETYVSLTAAATVDIDCETGNYFSLSTGQNTTFTFSNPPATGTGFVFILEITQGGAYTLTWPAAVAWAGGAAPDAPGSSEVAVYAFATRDGGTTWYGFQAGTALA
jgi:hypothetical protein